MSNAAESLGDARILKDNAAAFFSRLSLASLLGLPPQVMLLVTLGGYVLPIPSRLSGEKPNVSRRRFGFPLSGCLSLRRDRYPLGFTSLELRGSGATTVEEGSPIDADCFFDADGISVFMFCRSDRLVYLAFIEDNRGSLVFILYCFVAVFWSDFPRYSFKRWIKIFSHPIMLLIIFSEPEPGRRWSTRDEEVRLRALPSFNSVDEILFQSRNYSRTSGAFNMNIGIAEGKNELGAICVIFGLFLSWRWLQVWRQS